MNDPSRKLDTNGHSKGALDIIIPVYNEDPDVVRRTVETIISTFRNLPHGHIQIILVDDGSDTPLPPTICLDFENTCVIRHAENKGYGAALKTGIRKGSAPWIAITDADGTYPVGELPLMYEKMQNADMVVGVRTGDIRHIPILRRAPKYMLNRLASYLAGRRIADLNSGMRIFSRNLAIYLWELFPAGFSFTSTLTMGGILGNFEVLEHSINYYKRVGASAIKPIQDTFRFFQIVFRLGVLFRPFRTFGPLAGVLLLIGTAKGLGRDFIRLGYVGNLSITFMLAGLQIALMGLLAELIVHSRKLNHRAME